MWPALQMLPREGAPFLLRCRGDPGVELSIETEKLETTVQKVCLQEQRMECSLVPVAEHGTRGW